MATVVVVVVVVVGKEGGKLARYHLDHGIRTGARPAALQLPGVLGYHDTPSWPSGAVAVRPHTRPRGAGAWGGIATW